MNLLIAASNSESNILIAHSAEMWAFTHQHVLDIKKYLGNFVTFWCSSKTLESQGFYGIGVITGEQIPGVVSKPIWIDRQYYGAIPFKLLSNKKMPKDMVINLYGKTWNRKLCIGAATHLPPAILDDDELKKFILYMLK